MCNNNRMGYGIDSYVGNMRTGREIPSNSRNSRFLSRSNINQSNRIGSVYREENYMNDVNNEGHKPRNFSRLSLLDAKLELDYNLAKNKLLKAQQTGRFENSGNESETKHIYERKYPNECGDYYDATNHNSDYDKEYNQYLREHENPKEHYLRRSNDYDKDLRITYQKSQPSNNNINEDYCITQEFDEDNNLIEYEIRTRNAYKYDGPHSKGLQNTYNLKENKCQLDRKLSSRVPLPDFEQDDESKYDKKLLETKPILNFEQSKANKNISSSEKNNNTKDRQSENRRSSIEEKLNEKSTSSCVDKNDEIKNTPKKCKEKFSHKHGNDETLTSKISLAKSNQSEKASNITVRSKKIDDIKLLNQLKSKTLSVIDDGIQKFEQFRKECDKFKPETPSRESVQSQTDNLPMKSINSATDTIITSAVIPELCKELRKYQVETMQSQMQLLQYLEVLPEKVNELQK